ncbi:MAG: amidohydrolase family protein [Planctomycetes bacterium]|nr:amidohydrolase family protein [Planctomycetota bacterium]
MIVRAKFVVPVTGPIIENGAVAVSDGVITDVTSWPASGGHCDHDLGEAVLLPGFVNTHTHLELSHLQGRVDPGIGFVEWLESLGRMVRADDDPAARVAGVKRGARECIELGVTTVGDITRRPSETRAVLRDGPLRVVSFGEVIAIGPIRTMLNARLQAATQADHVSNHLRIGVSPHSPYTVEPSGFHACRCKADELGLPMTIHVAETPDERLFTSAHDGPLRAFLERVDAWDENVECPSASPVEFLDRIGCLGPRTLLAHVNYVGAEEIQILARSGAHVVYCPRTHAAFGHAPHPYREMRRAGINVCLGTDSLASNPSLSVLDEARMLYAKYPDEGAKSYLEMITLCAARALGWDDVVGSLSPGMAADMTAVRLETDGPDDPLANVLGSDELPVQTFINGTVVYPSPREPSCET